MLVEISSGWLKGCIGRVTKFYHNSMTVEVWLFGRYYTVEQEIPTH